VNGGRRRVDRDLVAEIEGLWTVNPTWDPIPAYDNDEAALREATS
jgi:hypothetical protein